MKKKNTVNLAENQEQMIVILDHIVMSEEDHDTKEGEVQTEVDEDMMTIGEDMKMTEDAMTEIEKEDGEGNVHDFFNEESRMYTWFLEHDPDHEKNIVMNADLQSHITEMEKMEPDKGIDYKIQ